MKKNLVCGLLLLSVLTLSLNSCRTDEMLTGTEQTQKEKIAFFERFEKDKSLSKNAESNNYVLPFGNSMLAYFNNYPEKKTELENKYGTVDLKVSSQDIDLENGRKLLIFPMLTDGKVTAVIGGVINAERDFLYFDVYKEGHPDHSLLMKIFQNHYDTKTVSRNDSNNPINVGDVIIIVKKPQLSKPDPWDDLGGDGGHDMGGGNGDFTDGGGSGSGSNTNNSNTEPCNSIKASQANAKYAAKFDSLNKKSVFDMDKERGFYEIQPPKGIPSASGFVQIDGPPGTTGLDLPDNTDRISGLFHSHNNKEGSIKIFSPTDVRTFINTLLKNAREYGGGYGTAYSTLVTSQGSYTLKYTGTTHPGGVDFNTMTNWNTWYEKAMAEISNEDGEFPQNKVEDVFSRFLQEVVGKTGLEVFKVTEKTASQLKYNPNSKKSESVPCS